MKDKKVSVIVPIYKVPYGLLKQCLNSIINQTYKNLEIILVDDGSPDDCPKICDEYAKKDGRIINVHQKNKGLAGARNTGLKRASGEYVIFVDGDDYLESNGINILAKYTNDNIDVIRGSFYKDYGNHKEILNINNVKFDYIYNKNKNEIIFLKENVLKFNSKISSVCGTLYRTDFLKKNRLYNDEKLSQGSEDVEFSFRLYDYVNMAVYIEKPIYHYVFNNKSISAFSTDENNYKVLRCFEKIKSNIEKISDNAEKEKLNNLFYTRLDYVIVTSMISGYFNPNHKINYKTRKKYADKFLENEMLVEAMKKCYTKNIDLKRQIIIFLVKNKFYNLIFLLGKIRQLEKNN